MNLFRMHILIPVDEEAIQAGVFDVKRELESEIGKRNMQGEIKVLETGTVGAAGKGVVLIVYPDNIYYSNVRREDVAVIMEEHVVKGRVAKSIAHETGEELKRGHKEFHQVGLTRKQPRVILDKCCMVDSHNIEEVISYGGYQALEKIVSEKITPQRIIDEVKNSGLRGRGGAGFPTGLKWSFTAQAPGEEKYVICNADEGEPGTFKDRLILEGDPHKLVEAMIITGYAVGSRKGFIYIRGEYQLSIERVQRAIDDAMANGLLGDNILGSDITFHLEIKKGAGAYVCGEETALIESLEGDRGNPRVKPPYPAAQGLWQKPTLVNNVETLANVPHIVFNGADWYRTLGTDKCPGTKVFTILGHVEYPGLIEVEMGTPLREIIYNYGGGVKDGKRFKAALVGGAAGMFLPDRLLDVPMDYESLKENAAVLGSGAILVMNEDASILEMLHSVLEFFAHESCGQCSPCRIGTKQLLNMVEDFRKGEGAESQLDAMIRMSETMFNTSLCPLGQSLIMPVKSALENFREEFPAKTKTKTESAIDRRKK